MTHENALNKILSHACSNSCEVDSHHNEIPGSFRTYRIELCCENMIVTAKPLGKFKFEIKSVEIAK